MKKLNSTEASQILAIHYLPGLRYAVEQLQELIQDLSRSTEKTEPPKITLSTAPELDNMGRRKPKIHWTQTPEGRRKMAKITKARFRNA